jgi:dipeptidyl aminopeptidase/acylaminoacyl peptidase
MKLSILFSCLTVLSASAHAQVTAADYQRAAELRTKYQGLAIDIAGPIVWIEGTDDFWYRKSVKGGNQFMLVTMEGDGSHPAKKPAFDHAKLAASLSTASGETFSPLALPFTDIKFGDKLRSLQFVAAASSWTCDLSSYACQKTGPAPQGGRGGGRGGRGPVDDLESPAEFQPGEFQNDVDDGIAGASPQQAPQQGAGRGGLQAAATPDTFKASPDGKWEALIENFNVFIRAKGKRDAQPISWDGSEGNYYTFRSIAWSPDSNHLAAYRVRPGYKREVHYVESSPLDQLQPKHSTRDYAKPGDTVDVAQPVLFNIDTRKQIIVDNAQFPNPYSLTPPVWWKDGRGFTFEYNQRGHQTYRVIEVDAQTGKARTMISEESQTFVDYRALVPDPRDTGKKVRYDVNDGKEVIWASERDGWEHLYLYDGVTGQVKNQITKGEWVVRAIDKVDETKRQIWFEASGMNPKQDPYFMHAYRINFDGTGLTKFTDADGDHTVKYSSDMKFYTDTWSRVDLPPTIELHRTEDAKVVMEVEHGDIQALRAAGWHAPEAFSAKGRDGKTDIWGVINWPAKYDPAKKYPVIESIYAGPQGSFVPKNFTASTQVLTELGFIVVQIDGMGTNNRSKAFHDVAWKDLADAGFADRILWHKAAAAKYSSYDISRVGVYGTSAGGQNSMGALLFHPEFYKVAVSNSGCHDNRMDKIWWNEQWMGWPLGPHYAASSNVDNAGKLQGKLLLVVGEMDTNVDPASTLQVVNALIKADKKFDLLFVPGGGHGAGGTFGQRLLEDFFVHNLAGQEPPDWNREKSARPSRTGDQ